MFDEIPPHLMRLELLSLDDAALISAGLDPMVIGNCGRAEKENWTGWEIAKANRKFLLQAVVLKKIRPVSATVWVSNEMYEINGWEEEIDVYTITVKHLNSLYDAIFRRDDVLAFFGYQTKPEQATAGPSQSQAGYLVNGPTYANLMQAIEAFPVEYPNYQNTPPQQKNIKTWLISNFDLGDKDRTSSVFATIIKEHFGLTW